MDIRKKPTQPLNPSHRDTNPTALMLTLQASPQVRVIWQDSQERILEGGYDGANLILGPKRLQGQKYPFKVPHKRLQALG